MDDYQTYQLISAIPELLVWGAGALLCLKWSQRRPVTASMLGVALLIQAARRLLILYSPQISDYISVLFPEENRHYIVLFLVFGIPNAISWGLLLGALAREFAADQRADLAEFP